MMRLQTLIICFMVLTLKPIESSFNNGFGRMMGMHNEMGSYNHFSNGFNQGVGSGLMSNGRMGIGQMGAGNMRTRHSSVGLNGGMAGGHFNGAAGNGLPLGHTGMGHLAPGNVGMSTGLLGVNSKSSGIGLGGRRSSKSPTHALAIKRAEKFGENHVLVPPGVDLNAKVKSPEDEPNESPRRRKKVKGRKGYRRRNNNTDEGSRSFVSSSVFRPPRGREQMRTRNEREWRLE